MTQVNIVLSFVSLFSRVRTLFHAPTGRDQHVKQSRLHTILSVTVVVLGHGDSFVVIRVQQQLEHNLAQEID